MRIVTKILVLAAGLGWTAVVAAAALPDPTRPPDLAAVAREPAARAAAPVLQSTLVSPTRRVAIISGQPVKVGDTFQGAVVTDITAYEVRLSRDGRETSLRLLPKMKEETGGTE